MTNELSYGADLIDCHGVNSAEKEMAESRFRAALETQLGGTGGVRIAYAAYLDSVCADDLDNTDVAPVERWLDAEADAERAAFDGWHRRPESAYFEIII